MQAETQYKCETVFAEINEGDRVEVEIESPCNPFGSTQGASFDASEIRPEGGVVLGHDETWGDDVEIIGRDEFEYADGGKSGRVEEIRVMETTDDGVTIHGSGTVVYKRD